MDPAGVTRREVERIGPQRDETLEAGWDSVVVEEPLEIRVDGETVGITMRTPGDDGRLALGFLFAEGIISSLADVGTVTHCGRPGHEGYGNVLEVRSAPGVTLDADRILEGRRMVPTSSACGVCGRRSIRELIERCKPVEGGPVLAAEMVARCVARLAEVQPRFAKTGGIHAAAAFDATGELLACHEDVGRHNAVDKTVGELLRYGMIGPDARGGLRPALLVVSGRAGFEIVQKAAVAGFPVVASVSAATSLSIDLAVAAGITLCGFARGGSLNLYSHAWRIAAAADGGGSKPLLRSVPTAAAEKDVDEPASVASPAPRAVAGGSPVAEAAEAESDSWEVDACRQGRVVIDDRRADARRPPPGMEPVVIDDRRVVTEGGEGVPLFAARSTVAAGPSLDDLELSGGERSRRSGAIAARPRPSAGAGPAGSGPASLASPPPPSVATPVDVPAPRPSPPEAGGPPQAPDRALQSTDIPNAISPLEDLYSGDPHRPLRPMGRPAIVPTPTDTGHSRVEPGTRAAKPEPDTPSPRHRPAAPVELSLDRDLPSALTRRAAVREEAPAAEAPPVIIDDRASGGGRPRRRVAADEPND